MREALVIQALFETLWTKSIHREKPKTKDAVKRNRSKQLPAMTHDLARRLKKPPAHGLHLATISTTTVFPDDDLEVDVDGGERRARYENDAGSRHSRTGGSV